jgi:PhnB protein
MAKATSHLGKGFRSVNVYLVLAKCGEAIDWYKRVFGAEERMRMPMPGDKIGHAELKIGDTIICLADSMEGWPPTNSTLLLYVPDCDAIYERATKEGAKIVQPMGDKFYGDRMGTVTDPFGVSWSIATHQEDLTEAELMERAKTAIPS